MLTVQSASEPSWNVDRSAITLLVVFEEHAATLGAIPFTASPEDNESYGRELFTRAVALEFGPIEEPSTSALEQAVTLTRSRLSAIATATISSLQTARDTLQDALRLNLATEAEAAALPLKQAALDAWCAYRVYLSRIESQAGFPATVDWPTAPAVV
jgi:Trk-type K+ transport system membrane component